MTATPREVLEQLIEGVPARRWDDLPALYSQDTVVEQPYALPEPIRLVGRAALAAHFQRAARVPLSLRADNIVIRETDDPEVVVGEFDYHARNTETGASVTVANVIVARVRAGEIVESRDFHHHVALAALFRPAAG
jgi:uncharacterized protein